MSRTELDWFADRPEWLRDLHDSRALDERGVTWLDQNGSVEAAAELRSGYAGEDSLTGPPDDERLRAFTVEAEGKIPVAVGPSVTDLHGLPAIAYWLAEPGPAGRLWLAPSRDFHPFSWMPLGTGESAIAAVEHHYPSPGLTRVDLTRELRVFIGYRHEIGDMRDLERAMTFNRMLDFGAWCSGHLDDPWPKTLPEGTGMLAMSAFQSDTASIHDPGRPWSQSWRTKHSGSHFTLEVHQRDLFVLSVRYRPSPHLEAMERSNAHNETRLPLDLPPDVACAMDGFVWADVPDLEADLAAAGNPAEIAGLLRVLAALWDGDFDKLTGLRRWAAHPSHVVHAALWDAALQYNLQFLCDELLLTGTSEQLTDMCARVQRMGGFPEQMRHRDAFPGQTGTEPYDEDDEEEDE
ncbi:hypothetical protein [Phytomonospora endophytica]|uniref:Uncharacterized protein n=1 Tax=Phytomonospora endophytica TaxID=714109 RepID=A0A841FV79_9ACTN|nr:hypothetical protein [Phytomonospora endophytica]MBB6036409.1 hypothetical protein [Phytomonospora endophytica]